MAKFTPLLGGISGKLGAVTFSRNRVLRLAPGGHPTRNRPLSNLSKMLRDCYAANQSDYYMDCDRWSSRNVHSLRLCGIAHPYFRHTGPALYDGERIGRGMVPSNVTYRDQSRKSGGARLPETFELVDTEGGTALKLTYPEVDPEVDLEATVYIVVIRMDGLIDAVNDPCLRKILQPTATVGAGFVTCVVPQLDEFLTGSSYLISTGAVFIGDDTQPGVVAGQPWIANGCNMMGIFEYPWVIT